MMTVPLAEARANLSRFVEDAVRTHERVEITRNGTRAAVLMSADDYDSLMETIDILADADLVKEVGKSIAEMNSGEVYGLAEVTAEMRALGRLPQ